MRGKIWFILLVLIPIEASAQTLVETLARNKDRIQQWMATPERITLEDLDQAIRHSQEMLLKYPDRDFTPTIMFQLAELYVLKSRKEYEDKMAQYEADIKRYDQGILKEEPVQPRIDFTSARELCNTILKRYPDLDFKDKILYRLALCYHEEGNKERATEVFQQLVRETPKSPLVPEAYFRIGEYYFDIGQYPLAIQAYKKLLDINKWENVFFDAALYKLGWSYYKINSFSEAISSFVFLLDDIETLEKTELAVLDKTIIDLKKEALDYIAISFSEFGGPEKAEEFFQTIGMRDYTLDVFQKLGDIYFKQHRFPEAIRTYKTLLRLYPLYTKAPQIQLRIVECHEKNWDPEGANRAREVLVQNYGPGSAWLIDKAGNIEIQKEALELVQDALFKIGTFHHKRAGKGIDPDREYRLAIKKYREFLKKFPEGEKAYKVNYLLAECLYEIGEYTSAAEEYGRVIENYQERDYFEQAAYNRILAYDKAIQNARTQHPDTLYLQKFLGVPVEDTLIVNLPLQKNLILACDRFITLLPESDKVPEVLMKMAEIFYDLDKYRLARKVYMKVAENFKESPYGCKALMMVAQCYFREGDFFMAREWCEKVAKAVPDTCPLARKARKLAATSLFKSAESLKKKGEALSAGQKFEQVFLRYPDLEIAEAAAFEAASQYEAAGQEALAAQVLELFVSSHPSSKLADEACLRASMLREKLGQWGLAARNYLKLARGNPSPERAPKALFSAGICYRNLQDWSKVREIFSRYVQLYPQEDGDKYVEALFRIGEAYLREGRSTEAERAFQRTVDVHRRLRAQGKVKSDYFAAWAQFLIGEIHYDEYTQIKLVPPLKLNLKRKQRVFKKVMNDYTEAAKYKVAEWTIAASHRIGMTFEEFAKAMLESSPPPGLSEEELKLYRAKLEENARPMQMKALEFYKANIQRAKENGIDNQWVQRSKERIDALTSELGLKEDYSIHFEESYYNLGSDRQ